MGRRWYGKKRFNGRRKSSQGGGFRDDIVVRRFTENRASAVLKEVFSVHSINLALATLVRLKHSIGRDQSALSYGDHGSALSKMHCHVRTINHHLIQRKGAQAPLQNVHHLTPRPRRDMPFHGNGRSNLLALKMARHKAWHDEFGIRTLEEIILLMAECARISNRAQLIALIDRLIGRIPLKRRQSRKLISEIVAILGFTWPRGSPGPPHFYAFLLYCRAAGNRTLSTCTQNRRTTGIRRPATPL